VPNRHSTRLDRSAAVSAAVVPRIYPGMGHTINDDELAQVRRLLGGIGPRS
jgi:hypothetical protein